MDMDVLLSDTSFGKAASFSSKLICGLFFCP